MGLSLVTPLRFTVNTTTVVKKNGDSRVGSTLIGGSAVRLIVYADFSCPDCYLASRRADALSAAEVAIDWRAVEHWPHLPVTGLRLSGSDKDVMTERFTALRDLLLPGERLPFRMPALAPKTESSISAYAEVYGSRVGDDVRRLLFELYWLQGYDIGSPTALRTPLAGPILRARSDAEPLRESGYAVSVGRGPITSDAHRRIRTWRAEWQQLGSPTLPVVLSDAATLSGIDALRRLGKEIGYVGATVEPALGDPRRYPQVAGRPPENWVSQIGGRWRYAYRPTGAR
jgi:hypothetical protein